MKPYGISICKIILALTLFLGRAISTWGFMNNVYKTNKNLIVFLLDLIVLSTFLEFLLSFLKTPAENSIKGLKNRLKLFDLHFLITGCKTNL